MNITIKTPQKSSNFSKNPYDATGLSDSAPASPIELEISRITVDFGRNCQDKLNFAALVGLRRAIAQGELTTALEILEVAGHEGTDAIAALNLYRGVVSHA